MDSTLASRLSSTRKAKKLTQVQLSELSGVNQSDISKIERGQTAEPRNVLALAQALGVDPYWLRYGSGSNTETTQNVTSVNSRGKVPLISWIQAGDLQGVIDVYAPGEAEEWVDASEFRPSGTAFALKVVGDSMVSPYPNSRSFPPGTVLLVDPEVGASAGDYVIAKDVVTQKATFKKLMHDAGRWYLKPLNPIYPTVEIDSPELRVIARVMEYQLRGKL